MLNLKQFNHYMQILPVKMSTIQQGDYAFAIDVSITVTFYILFSALWLAMAPRYSPFSLKPYSSPAISVFLCYYLFG